LEYIKTDRLILRPWREEDFEPFAELNADPRVMECFPSVLSREKSNELAKKISFKIKEQGWGLWAVSVPGAAYFIGFIGLSAPSFKAHFTPAVEVGWRLSYDYWGRGYATERAKAAIKYGFEKLGLEEIVSFTAEQNHRSISVMKRIGMHHDPSDDFDHPSLPIKDRLCRHVLYRVHATEWMERLNDNR